MLDKSWLCEREPVMRILLLHSENASQNGAPWVLWLYNNSLPIATLSLSWQAGNRNALLATDNETGLLDESSRVASKYYTSGVPVVLS